MWAEPAQIIPAFSLKTTQHWKTVSFYFFPHCSKLNNWDLTAFASSTRKGAKTVLKICDYFFISSQFTYILSTFVCYFDFKVCFHLGH